MNLEKLRLSYYRLSHFLTPTHKGEELFFPFFESLCKERHRDGVANGTLKTWEAALLQLKKYDCNPMLTLREVDRLWLEGFKRHLDNSGLAPATKACYFAKLRSCMNEAQRRGLIPSNPCTLVKGYRKADPKRVYLTLEELRALAGTPCGNESLRSAFLFSCLTGLRKSDIQNLRWNMTEHNGGYLRIVFRQQKTGGLEYLDISHEAEKYMGPAGEGEERIFKNFRYGNYTSWQLRKWAIAAGIHKNITFHTGRHTFAVLLLNLGVDIYTLQKLLGHRSISTTQVYADLLDKTKQAAVSLIPRLQ